MAPKSEKLQREEAERQERSSTLAAVAEMEPSPLGDGPIEVRQIPMFNDFIAILQFQVQIGGGIVITDDDSKYKNEGLVIGVGPGVADGGGGRLRPGPEFGDVVMFGPRNIVAQIESNSPPYQGQKIVIVSERNVICKLPIDCPYTIYEED